MYDDGHVTRGYGFFRTFANKHGLGKPNKIMRSETSPFNDWEGVACEWKREGQKPARHAIEDRSANRVANCRELIRRLKHWEE